jgi:putative oxidoreductase
MLVPHGWLKLSDALAMSATVALFHKLGLEPAAALVWLVGLFEILGGVMLAFGLLTRPVALAVTIEMGVISLLVFRPNGFFAGQRGYEHTLLWGLLAFAIAWRGGGKYSLDRLIGREF